MEWLNAIHTKIAENCEFREKSEISSEFIFWKSLAKWNGEMQFTQKSPKMANFAKNPKFAYNSNFENYWLNTIRTKIAENGEFREKSEICLEFKFWKLLAKCNSHKNRRKWRISRKIRNLLRIQILKIIGSNGMAKCNSHKNRRKWRISRKIRNLLRIHILKIIGQMKWLNTIHTKIAENGEFREKSEICLEFKFWKSLAQMEWLNAIHTKIAENGEFREKSEICSEFIFWKSLAKWNG